MNTDQLVDTSESLAGATCPGCESPVLELTLEASDAGRTVHSATCLGCDMTFRVHTGRPPAEIEARLSGLNCPDCAAGAPRFVRVCELPGLTCGLSLSCSACDRTFGEDVV